MKLSARIPLHAVLAVTLAMSLFVPAADGQTVHGRITTSFYRYDRAPTDSTDFSYVRAYALGILHIDGLGDPRFSLHTYMTGSQDLASVNHDVADYRVSNLYAQWKDRAHAYEFRGGRMRIFAGVGNVLIDGGFGSYRFRDLATLEAFAGVQAPLTGEFEVQSWENRAYGGRLTFHQPRNLTAAVSYCRRNRESLPYEEPGEYTERLLVLPDGQEELYGANAAWDFRPGATAYGRVEVDRLPEWRLKCAGGALNLSPPETKWSADIEYFHRAPSVYANSLFSTFSQADYDEVAARASYMVTPTVRTFGHISSTFLDDDSGQYFGLGVGRGPWSVSYTHRMGYTGDADAVTGTYQNALTEMGSIRIEAGYTSFDAYAGQDERNDSIVLTFGGEARPTRTLAFDIEIQNLSQDLYTPPGGAGFAGYEHDWRGHIRITYWFFSGRNVTGVF